MVYLLAILIVVVRVFGLTNTINFISKLLSPGASPRDYDKPDLKETMDKMFRKRSESDEASQLKHVSRDPSNTANANNRFGEVPPRKPPPRRKNRSQEPRFVQNAGRSSQEILAGRPDFGWRRVH